MSGPSGHPGVVIVENTTDKDATVLAVTTALSDGYKFVYTYEVNQQSFTVFAQGYKGK